MDAESNAKKVSLEDLPQDELIKKCKGLLNILQKAKQSKETLIEENRNLKEKLNKSEGDTEMLESLIQQKVHLVTTLEEIKSQKKVLENKLKDCEYSLSTATNKIVNLDNENEGCRKQIGRLVEENEQLLTSLSNLEKETEQLKQSGIKQSEQILKLDEECVSAELLNYQTLKARFEQLEESFTEVQSLNKGLGEQNEILMEKCKALSENIKILEENSEYNTKFIDELQKTNLEKDNQIDEYQNILSKLNLELKEQTTLVETLRQETDKVGVTKEIDNSMTDLQDTNDKLKDKLKLFHSKLVKFASDVKLLKQEKNEVLHAFKDYIQQVKLWENQLKEFSFKVINQFTEFESNKSQFSLEYDSLKIKFDSMEKENLILNTHNKQLSDTINDLNLKINSDQSEKLHSDNKALIERLNNVIKQFEELKAELETLKGERNLLKEQYHGLIEESQLLHHKVQMEKSATEAEESLLREKNAQLLFDIESQRSELTSALTQNELLKKDVDEYKASLTEMDKKVAAFVEENKNLSEKLGNLQEILFQTENTLGLQKEQLTASKKENNELLVEMNEMNQVIKERGETISKQQEYCEELLKKLNVHESQHKKYLELVNERDCTITKLEENIDALKSSALKEDLPSGHEAQHSVIHKENEEILLLRNEISALKEKLTQVHDTSQEVSYAESETLSTSTISKAEDSNRFKDFEGSWEERYGKLRLLALKLKGKIRETTEQIGKEQIEKNELQQKLASSHKVIQTLQTQCDVLQDELDKKKAELLDYTKQLDIAANNKSTHLKSLADNDELITKLKLEIEALNKEKLNTDTWKKQVSSKVQNLKRELDANIVVKKELEEQVNKLSSELEDKSKLLNDEIEKHNATKNLLLESHNECKKQSVLNLEIQDYERSLKEFTQKLEKKQETITKLKNQVDQLQNSISSIKEQNRLLEERLQSEENDLISARGELHTYKKRITDLETIVAEKDEKLIHLTHTLECSREENENLSTHLSKVVGDNQKLCDSLKSDKQLLHTQNSGLEMKIREMNDNLRLKNEELEEIRKEYEAYKVRAQSVLRSSQVRDVGLEEKLREEVASFCAQIQVLTSEINDLRNLTEILKGENAKLIVEKEDLQNKWHDTESALEDQKHLYNMLSLKHQKTVKENSETISSLKVHADTLSQCYRQQLSEQETRHNKEIIELQSKIEKVTPVLEPCTLIPPLTPREQGEGSECIDAPSSAKVNSHHPLPLDKLLNNELEQDVGFLRKQVTEHETKVNYLTSLLADTEQDLVKHVQMNKLLKEEIRRHQRSVEREKHAENLEYLKNIIFKFVTLNSGDERSHLVPVLNTILKLSPEETNQLTLVARGEASGRGWSDYLPVWSSGKFGHLVQGTTHMG